MEKEKIKVCFIDIDGVFNDNQFYHERHRKQLFTIQHWWWWLTSKIKWVFNGFKYKSYTYKFDKKTEEKWKKFEYRFEHLKEETDIVKLRWFDETCKNINAKVVISSTWRSNFTIEEWNKAFLWLGLDNIDVIGVTGYDDSRIRGREIKAWLDEHKEVEDFVIIDDDSDMLESQRTHFFPTDNYCGLTPSVLYRIERHFRKESKYLCGVSIAKDYL